MTSKQLRDFILWCRSERISFTSITAGGITLDGVVDGKIERAKPTKAEPRPSMFERYAQELMNQPEVHPSESVPDEARQD